MKDAVYKDTGIRLRAVRDKLDLTLEDLNSQIGISRSYVSDFERGIKLPTVKYLRHLHDTYNISLHYIFGSDPRMFRPTKEEQNRWSFGKYQEEVEEMLDHMTRKPHALFGMILKFTEYKMENQKYIENIMPGADKDDEND